MHATRGYMLLAAMLILLSPLGGCGDRQPAQSPAGTTSSKPGDVGAGVDVPTKDDPREKPPHDSDARPPRILTEAIKYEHDTDQLEGYLAYDAAREGKRPAVLVVHDWWGLDDHAKVRARRLAGLGYVAFCCDMYGGGRHTDDVNEAENWSNAFYSDQTGFGRARARAAYRVLAAHARVDAKRMAAIGFGYGGAVALQLAWSGADIDGVVCFHGSLPAPDDADVEDVKAAVLVLVGERDAWVSEEMRGELTDALEAAGLEHKVVVYEGASQAFTDAKADDRGVANMAYDAKADSESWTLMKKFLQTCTVR